MEQKAGAQISQKAVVQSLLILFGLMLAAGILTWGVPAGRYTRTAEEGREVIDPASFQHVSRPDYPIWRWFRAPLEVLWGPDNVTLIVIILFLVLLIISYSIVIYTLVHDISFSHAC